MRRWIEGFCREYGLDVPSPEETEALLQIAKVAAHASGVRPAAPVTTFLAGILVAAKDPSDRARILQDLADALRSAHPDAV